MPYSWNDYKLTFAGRAGTALHYIDRFCTVLYLAGAASVGAMLAWMAFTKTLWLLLLAIPMLVTTGLFFLGYLRNPNLGLRIEWPIRRQTRKLNIINKSDINPTD